MSAESAERPQSDKVLTEISDYIHDFKSYPDLAIETARLCLIDTVGCGLEALRFKHCANLLGPVVEGTVVPNGMLRHVQDASAKLSSMCARDEGAWNELPA